MAYITTGLTNGGVTAHYKFSYDQALAAPSGPEPARTNAVIAACEADYNLMHGWFGGGVSVTGMSVQVTTQSNGAGWSGSASSSTIQLKAQGAKLQQQLRLSALPHYRRGRRDLHDGAEHRLVPGLERRQQGRRPVALPQRTVPGREWLPRTRHGRRLRRRRPLAQFVRGRTSSTMPRTTTATTPRTAAPRSSSITCSRNSATASTRSSARAPRPWPASTGTSPATTRIRSRCSRELWISGSRRRPPRRWPDPISTTPTRCSMSPIPASGAREAVPTTVDRRRPEPLPQQMAGARARQNLRLSDIEVTTLNGQTALSGIWEEGTDGYYLWVDADTPHFIAKWRRSPSRIVALSASAITTVCGPGRGAAGSDGYYLWVDADQAQFPRQVAGSSPERTCDLSTSTPTS